MRRIQKDKGGYALLYVLIVVVVLCAVATIICTMALRNLQAQERSVTQTEQLYKAEGEIEKYVALAEDVSGLADTSDEYSDEATAKEKARTDYIEYLESLNGGYIWNFDAEPCKFTLAYECETVRVESTVSMALDYTVTSVPHTSLVGGVPTPDYKYKARVSKAVHTYNTYTITHLTTEGGEGHETE